MRTVTSGRISASSQASSALSTASLTVVSSALRLLSKPSRCRFLAKNSETEISRCFSASSWALVASRLTAPPAARRLRHGCFRVGLGLAAAVTLVVGGARVEPGGRPPLRAGRALARGDLAAAGLWRPALPPTGFAGGTLAGGLGCGARVGADRIRVVGLEVGPRAADLQGRRAPRRARGCPVMSTLRGAAEALGTSKRVA
jgi:hypothetical protein